MKKIDEIEGYIMADPRRMRFRLAMAVSLIVIFINIIMISSGVADSLYVVNDYSVSIDRQQPVSVMISRLSATN